MPLDTLAQIRAADTQAMRWVNSTASSLNLPFMICHDYLFQTTFPAAASGENPTEYGGVPALRRAGRLISLQGGYPGRPGTALYDRMWVSGKLLTTVDTTHTIDSITFPARDVNGTVNGEGCQLGIILRSSGEGLPSSGMVTTVTYTNSAGVSGRTSSMTISGSIGPSFRPFSLQSGDTGVQSVQSVQVSGSTAGSLQVALLKLISRMGSSHYGVHAGSANGYRVITPGFLRAISAVMPAGTVGMPMHGGGGTSFQSVQTYEAVFALEGSA